MRLGREHPAAPVVDDQHLARLQLHGVRSRASSRASAAPAGGCRPRSACRASSSSSTTSREVRRGVRPPPTAGRRTRRRTPEPSAYGATVATQRVLLEVTSRVTPYAASSGTSRSACAVPVASSGRNRSSAFHGMRERALACRSTISVRVTRPRRSASRRVSRSWRVGQQLRGLLAADPRDLVDLVVRGVAADVVVADHPADPVVDGLVPAAGHRVALVGERPARAGSCSPVSSATSRTAALVACSPRSSLPLGNDQSSYFGRCTSSTSSLSCAAPRHPRRGRRAGSACG